MTKEEAIRLLDPETTEEAIAEIRCELGVYSKPAVIEAINEACVIAVECMRKQVPQEVIENENYSYWDGEKNVRDRNTCQNCKMMLEDGKYCKECGQALIWRDEV